MLERPPSLLPALPAPIEMPMERLSIVSGRARLVCERTGPDVEIVFLHAGVSDRRLWRSQMNALAPRWTSLAYDRRGFGETMHVDEPWSMVGDLQAVLSSVSAERPVVLVGCSQGGRIAIDCALLAPERVRALVLVAPAISGAPQPADYPPKVRALFEELERADAASDVERVNAIEAHLWLDGPTSESGRVGGSVRELFLAMNGIALRSLPLGAQAEAAPAWERLAELQMPTMLVWGDLDFAWLQERCRHLARALPRMRAHLMRGAAHLPNLERPQEFNRELLAFMEVVLPKQQRPQRTRTQGWR